MSSPARNKKSNRLSHLITLEERLRCEDIEKLANASTLKIRLSPELLKQVRDSHSARLKIEQSEDTTYGINTGFGPHVKFNVTGDLSRDQAQALLAHLGVGTGAAAPREVVRATILLRVLTVSRGFSGIRLGVLRAYANLLVNETHPFVPEIGSLGASGDLIPLSHIARSLFTDAHRLRLQAREALALTNGTSFSAAMAVLAVARTERLLLTCEKLAGWMHASLSASLEALDEGLHAAGGHSTRESSAANIRNAALELRPKWQARVLQEPYSIRCAPQVLGACRANLQYARERLQDDLTGVDDNPLIFFNGSEPRAVHGGNFHGQQIAFAADALNQAQTQAGLLLERQLDLLMDPARNGGAPLLLAPIRGRSGLAGLQLTATALASEMRGANGPFANFSIPTNGGNQDLVPMAAQSARGAYQQTRRLAELAACLAMSLTQMNHLRVKGIASGPVLETPDWMPTFQGLDDDRALHDDLKRIADEFLALPRGG